jgi:hypothetical protein
MTTVHVRKRKTVGPANADAMNRSGIGPSREPVGTNRPTPAELEAFYSDPHSLDPMRLTAVESFVHRHGAGARARAEYLRYRRKVQMSHRGATREAVTD